MGLKYTDFVKGEKPVVFDGAFGTQIQKANFPEEFFQSVPGCNEILNLSRPEQITSLHTEYLKAGAQVIETNTFTASRPKLFEYGLADKVYEINKAGARAACKACENFKSDIPLFVCGTMGPTGYLPSSSDPALSSITFSELADIYEEQARGLMDGGADILLIETAQDLLEVRAAVFGIKRLFAKTTKVLPFQIQITVDASGRMLLGSTIESFLGSVCSLGPSVIGINCGTGPEQMRKSIEKLLKLSPFPVSMLPNAGIPHNVNGKAEYRMKPQEFAEKIAAIVAEKGLSVTGGCCGTTPEHISALVKMLKEIKSAKRYYIGNTCWLSTGIGGLDLEKQSSPVIIGERLNAQGSRKTKEFVLAQDYDELTAIAFEQKNAGCSLLDLCVAVNEQDNEAAVMKNLVSHLSERINRPFCIDTTEPAVLEKALQSSPGSVMINSINLEHRGEKARRILKIASDFGCPVIALTIDDDGVAKTVAKKVELAKSLRELVCGEFDIQEHYLYIDPLVFTLATGEPQSADSALKSIEAIEKISELMPQVRTVMGVSNVSFGLKPKARRILNNLMLYHAAKAGLRAAIFNPLHLDDIKEYDSNIRQAAEDLLFNRNVDALSKYVQLFENVNIGSPNKSVKNEQNLSDEQKLQNAVLNRDRRGLQQIIGNLLVNKSPDSVLNQILLPAMSEVGDRMASGDMILPFVLQAAEIMKEAVSILEPHMKDDSKINCKGKIVLATVYGDVHDIGKNLVGSILRNQGFEIIDLGKQVPIDNVVEAVKKEKPDAVGLSALLVTTSREMAKCVEVFQNQNISIPVLVGGAAVNKKFAQRISALPGGQLYSGGVYYAKDAFEATRVLESLKNSENHKDGKNDRRKKPVNGKANRSDCKHSSKQLSYGPHIEPPFWGTGEILAWEPQNLLDTIDKEKLFKAQWGGGNLSPEQFANARLNQFEPAFKELGKQIIESQLINPHGLYGYFPVITDNELLIILDPADFHSELAAFHFPRMERSGCISLADYFKPDGDIIGIQVVTIGKKLGDKTRDLFNKDDKYSWGFFLNGIGNAIVELMADRVSAEICRGIGLQPGSGRRYSFGYAGMPSLEEQKKLFELMGVEERLNISLTSGFQMDPEHSTMGIFVHHPQAQYLR